MDTLYKEFKQTAVANPSRPAVFWKTDGRWRARTYGEFLELVDSFAAGLRRSGVMVGDRVAIWSENRPEWLAGDLAINKIGAVSVPIHHTANREYFSHVMADSGSSVLITSGTIYEKNRDYLAAAGTNIKVILIADQGRSSDNRVISFSDLLDKAGSEEFENELSSIVYTSGTTGEPKGVMLSNANFLANVKAARQRIKVAPEDKFLSFLPLSHVLERTAGSFIPILTGASIAYAESAKKLADNLKEVSPTILISVPRIFEKMEEKILSGIKARGRFAQKLFFASLKKKGGALGALADRLVNRKIAKVFGGRLRFAVSGGASLDERILRFFNNLGISIIEGYGMTETAPVISVNPLERVKPGTVGLALPGVEIKISQDKEIMVRGANVMKGFWRLPELTKEKFTADGWLLTGDLGFLDKEGYLSIIGRKKEMIATSDGKKVNPEKLESALDLSPYISQSLVIGHGRGGLAALIVPETDNLKIEKNAEVRVLVSREIDKLNAKAMPHEQIRKFALLERPFTIESEELTPTLKVRRHIIEKKYHDLIASLYSN